MENRFKVRAWDKLSKKMRYNIGLTMIGATEYVDDGVPEKIVINRGQGCFILMQCTGLTDKNKIMDYEGNLLKDEFSTIYETVWNNKNSCFDFEIVKFGIEPKFYRDSYCADNLANMEIIGTKFEHPELLKGGE